MSTPPRRGTLRVATVQFATTGDPAANARAVVRRMREAAAGGADVVHFCEGALSGYAGADLASFDGYDWDALRAASLAVAAEAARLGVWVVVGSAHRRSRGLKPHNSVYVLDPRGRIVDRYDKRFCASGPDGTGGELDDYSPGDRACTFSIRGIRCGVLICHEYRYPELLRDLVRRGVRGVFHSFHAGHLSRERFAAMRAYVGAGHAAASRGATLPEITMPAAMVAAAASSHVWISAANSSARESCWPSFFVRADGVVVGRLRRNVAGVLWTTVDPAAPLYDSTRAWRGRALRSVLHSGKLARDPRSEDRGNF